MGFALAETLARRGAQVTLVTGPTHLKSQNPLIERVDVKTAAQMLEACQRVAPTADIIVEMSISSTASSPQCFSFF